METKIKSSQIGWVFIIVIPALTLFMYMQKAPGFEFLMALMVIVLLLFYSIKITIDKEKVTFSMGIGLIRGSYLISDVISCRPVRYSSMGWGIRLKSEAILFNVSGNEALELDVKGKSRLIWIGTSNPKVLCDAIHNFKAENSNDKTSV